MRWVAIVLLALLTPAEAADRGVPLPLPLPLDKAVAAIRAEARNPPPASVMIPSSDLAQVVDRRIPALLRQLKPDLLSGTRGEREVRLYEMTASAVVLIVTENGIGSGSLIRSDGSILTNWHVVARSREVRIVFKPILEGRGLTAADLYRARVVRVDEVADLALLKSEGIAPTARILPLGSMDEVKVGSDVHAIGHPTGESWTYTKGFVSQIRRGYEWSTDGPLRHRADVIQTQTPINPGNSGGPLLTDSGRLVGVNSFKAEGEGLNFAVGINDVQRFLASSTDRLAPRAKAAPPRSSSATCETRELKRGRNAKDDADQFALDLDCDGLPDAILTVPDRADEPITLFAVLDKPGGPSVLYVDTDRDGKWDISLYDTKGDGSWDLIGYHRNGEIRPYRFEPFVASK